MKKLIVFLLLFMAGCASVSVQRFDKEVAYPATKAGNIVTFPNKPVGKNFIELGEITVAGADNWIQVEKIFRSKAAEMGADAVYVFSKKEEVRQYISPDDCSVYDGYYYPYQHFGWHHYRPRHYYPRGYYYCYGYQSIETTTFISAVGIAIKYTNPA
jgi:hypothetical protein